VLRGETEHQAVPVRVTANAGASAKLNECCQQTFIGQSMNLPMILAWIRGQSGKVLPGKVNVRPENDESWPNTALKNVIASRDKKMGH